MGGILLPRAGYRPPPSCGGQAEGGRYNGKREGEPLPYKRVRGHTS